MAVKWRWIVPVVVLVLGAIVATVVATGGDDATFAEPQELIDRLERAGIEGCRPEDERTAGCFDVAGVEYFRGVLLDDDLSLDAGVEAACDASTILVLFVEGQDWFGRFRAHPERATDFAAALGSESTPCPETAAEAAG